MVLEKIRNQSFWLLDSIKGSPIRKHFKDIKYLNDHFSSKKTILRQKEYLDKILAHATSSTKFYSGLKGAISINDFPVVDKNIIRNNLDKFISDKFNKNDLFTLTTSGSTGTPFTVYQNKDKKNRNTADTIFFAKKAGYTLGEKLYYFKIWSSYNKKNGLLKWLQNVVSIDVLNLKNEIPTVFETINKNKTTINFIGYVSAFETYCKYLDKKESGYKPPFKVNSIITMSEALNDYTEKKMEAYFSCPVLSRYSNIENGIIAQQTIDNHHDFTINHASYYVEVMDMKEDKVLPFGELGRIVVTDYFNFGMPQIRYDTGDVGVIEEKIIKGKSQIVLSKVEGRKLDQLFNTKGELISSFIIYKNMWKYTELEQYQLIQWNSKDYIFKVCIKTEFSRKNELIKEFKSYLGEDANFKIEYVNEIPLLDSGKRKKVVNLMANPNN